MTACVINSDAMAAVNVAKKLKTSFCEKHWGMEGFYCNVVCKCEGDAAYLGTLVWQSTILKLFFFFDDDDDENGSSCVFSLEIKSNFSK